MRRGKPTVHKKWDENTAILSGDAMLILSFQFMMQGCPVEYTHQVMDIFSRTALEFVMDSNGIWNSNPEKM